MRAGTSDTFTGRVEELSWLGELLGAVEGGRAAMALLVGPAGIGKTRLVEQFALQASASGATIAVGACVPAQGAGLPLAPVVAIVRALAGIAARHWPDDAVVRAFGSVLAGLDLLPGGDTPAGDELAKTRLFDSFTQACRMMGDRSPVVLVIEDLHWVDSASRELIDFLVRNLRDARVLVVGTFRADALAAADDRQRWITELTRHARVSVIRVDALDRDAVAALVRSTVGAEADEALIERISTRSQGNPFFVEELIAARHSDVLTPGLRDVVLVNVEALSRPAQQLVRLAAAAGSSIDHQLLVAVARFVDGELETAIDEAVAARVLVVDHGRAEYHFRHVLARDAVYEMLMPGERQRLHQALADAIVTQPASSALGAGHRDTALALHAAAAGDWGVALSASKSAADAAAAVWAFPEALAHLERAIEAHANLGDDIGPGAPDLLDLLEHAAEVAALSARHQGRSAELAANAVLEAERRNDTARTARMLCLYGRNLFNAGRSDDALVAVRRAIALMGDTPSPELARAFCQEASRLMLLSRTTDAIRSCTQALEVARSVGARAEEGHALNTLGVCQGSLGFFDEGIALLREALAIADDLGDPADINRAYTNLSYILISSGRLEEGANVALAGSDVDGVDGFVRVSGAAGNAADALVRLGRWDEALRLHELLDTRGLGSCALVTVAMSSSVPVRRGAFEVAESLLASCDELTSSMDDVQLRGQFHMQRAEFLLESDDPEAADVEIERALATTATTDDEDFFPEMCSLAIRALGDLAADARARRSRFDLDKAILRSDALISEVEAIVVGRQSRGGEVPPRISALVSQCRAERSRLSAVRRRRVEPRRRVVARCDRTLPRGLLPLA